MRRAIARALLPALIGGVLLEVFWWAHDDAYNSLCPGVPDHGQVAIGTVPRLFWVYESFDTTIACKELFIPWILACAFFAVSPLVSLALSRGMAAHVFSLALLAAVVTHGCWNEVNRHVAGIEIFDPPLTAGKLAARAWPGAAWILALSLGGAGVGIVVGMVARATTRRRTPVRLNR